MAEINDAYESLRRGIAERRASLRREASSAPPAPGAEPAGRRAGGPPKPRPSRPVTGRVDTTETFRPRNATIFPGVHLRGHQPHRPGQPDREPPRASDPTGPLVRGRVERFRRPPRPSLEDARRHELDFGKFRGHTLEEVAAFEPSYIDWLAQTITRDPALVAAARVVRDDLDARGVVRHQRPPRTTGVRSA